MRTNLIEKQMFSKKMAEISKKIIILQLMQFSKRKVLYRQLL